MDALVSPSLPSRRQRRHGAQPQQAEDRRAGPAHDRPVPRRKPGNRWQAHAQPDQPRAGEQRLQHKEGIFLNRDPPERDAGDQPGVVPPDPGCHEIVIPRGSIHHRKHHVQEQGSPGRRIAEGRRQAHASLAIPGQRQGKGRQGYPQEKQEKPTIGHRITLTQDPAGPILPSRNEKRTPDP